MAIRDLAGRRCFPREAVPMLVHSEPHPPALTPALLHRGLPLAVPTLLLSQSAFQLSFGPSLAFS